MKPRGKELVGQPGTTWYNLFCEVVPPLAADLQWLGKTWYGWYNLFESLACGEGKQQSLLASAIYIRSWEKVVPSVPLPRKLLSLNSLRWYNLVFKVVPGCTTAVEVGW
jgi:hypothetical protein